MKLIETISIPHKPGYAKKGDVKMKLFEGKVLYELKYNDGSGHFLMSLNDLLEAYELIGAKLREKGVIMPNE